MSVTLSEHLVWTLIAGDHAVVPHGPFARTYTVCHVPAANEDRNVEMEDQRESAEFDSNEVSRDMKLDFVNKIKKLSNQGLTSVVEKIKEIKSNTISDLGNDKIQIRVDDFARNEFDTLMEHVEDLLVKELPSKRQKTH